MITELRSESSAMIVVNGWNEISEGVVRETKSKED